MTFIFTDPQKQTVALFYWKKVSFCLEIYTFLFMQPNLTRRQAVTLRDEGTNDYCVLEKSPLLQYATHIYCFTET